MNRKEKWLHHVAMVAIFLDDNKLKTLTRTVSNFIDLIQFHLICQMFANFLGLNPKGPYLSLEKEKDNFCVVLAYFVKRVREVKKFQVAVVQRRVRNFKKA